MAAQIFDLCYGITSSGKSKGIVELITYLLTQTESGKGKKFRVYMGDGGGSTYRDSGLVEAGLLEIIEFDGLDFPFTVLDLVTKYYAPDPKTRKWVAPPADFAERYMGTIFEGAAVAGKYLLSNVKGGLAYRAAHGEMIGNKNDDAIVKTKDETMPWMPDGMAAEIGSNTMGHYRHMQPRLLDMIKRSKNFPGSTPENPKGWVLWTSHPIETADRDEGGRTGDFGKFVGKTIVGPEMGGKAPAGWVSREFGNTWHFDLATKLEDETDEFSKKRVKVASREHRIYTRNHFDPDGNWLTEYRAGNRCVIPAMLPDFITDEKNDPAGFALVRAYQILAAAKAKRVEELKGKGIGEAA